MVTYLTVFATKHFECVQKQQQSIQIMLYSFLNGAEENLHYAKILRFLIIVRIWENIETKFEVHCPALPKSTKLVSSIQFPGKAVMLQNNTNEKTATKKTYIADTNSRQSNVEFVAKTFS